MTNDYTQVTIASNVTILTLPDTKSIVCYFGDAKIIKYCQIKSTGKSIRILDSKKKQVAYIWHDEEKTLMIAKPKWWQIIKRIKGEKRWIVE